MASTRIPSYRLHKPSGRAVVTIDGRDFYLGPHGSQASSDEYDRLIGEWMANHRRLPSSLSRHQITITELMAAYWEFAKAYYVKDGRPTDQQHGIRAALKLLRRRYGHSAVDEFGPLSLAALQQQMIELGLSRRYINDQAARIKRMFRWGVTQELVPVSVYEALRVVPGLARGRTTAYEPEPVRPVDDDVLAATLPHLSPVLRAMVQFQRYTACRPGEVCLVRPMDIDRSRDDWCYVPRIHKMQHRGTERRICVGPRAREVLTPFLFRDEGAYCFSPAEAAAETRAGRPARRPRKVPIGGSHYTTDSYRRAITRACDRANVEPWSPNQLRHAAATELRRRFGLEVAQTVLGHRHADVTQVYAERDYRLAATAMAEVG